MISNKNPHMQALIFLIRQNYLKFFSSKRQLQLPIFSIYNIRWKKRKETQKPQINKPRSSTA